MAAESMITIINRPDLVELNTKKISVDFELVCDSLEGLSFSLDQKTVENNARTKARNLSLFAGATIKHYIQNIVGSRDVKVDVALTTGRLHGQSKNIYSGYSVVNVGGTELVLGLVKRLH